jgi:hypothetical protein
VDQRAQDVSLVLVIWLAKRVRQTAAAARHRLRMAIASRP